MSATPRSLAEVNAIESDDGVEWGEYVERNDRGVWTPLVYSASNDREAAEEWVAMSRDSSGFRNARLVRRVVGDWKVVAGRDLGPEAA